MSAGRTLRAQGATAGSYYREMSYERGYIDCPHQRTGVRAEIVEQQMHHLVKYIQLPQDWLEQASSEVGDDEEIIQLRRQRDRLEAERRREGEAAEREHYKGAGAGGVVEALGAQKRGHRPCAPLDGEVGRLRAIMACVGRGPHGGAIRGGPRSPAQRSVGSVCLGFAPPAS